MNTLTAFISLATSLYLLPLVPSLMSSLDENLQSLKYLNQELEASKQKLITFMAFLCHEIRNPLFVITSNLTFLDDAHCQTNVRSPGRQDDDEHQDDEQVQALEAINQSADLMLRLVNDVLDIGKLESGKLELQEHDFELRKTLESVGASMERFVKRKHGENVTLITRIEDNVPRLAYADSVRLLQIVYNLLSNANKFTKNGRIGFTVSKATPNELVEHRLGRYPAEARLRTGQYDAVEETEAYGDSMLSLLESTTSRREQALRSPMRPLHNQIYLKIRVQDTGAGIAEEDLQQIFQPYAQAKLANYREQGGTGLGLAIVAKLATAMCGKVCAASELGQGTTFDVYVAVRRTTTATSTNNIAEQQPRACNRGCNEVLHPASDNNPSILVPSTDQHDPLSSSRREVMQPFPTNSGIVLVVEDNDQNRYILQRLLSQMNLQILSASDGQAAIEILFKSRNFTRRSEDPEIGMVLMDLSMPIMDGYEATRVIRSHRVFSALPIVALTAAATTESQERIIKAGCTEYQTKPIRREQLYQVCRRHLNNPWPTSTTGASDLYQSNSKQDPNDDRTFENEAFEKLIV